MTEFCPAHKEIIKRIALGHVELVMLANGKTSFIGANRQMVEELRQMKMVSTFKRSPSRWQYVLTDKGRSKLIECFDALEDDESIEPRETRYCKNCGKAFTPTKHKRVYCGECGNNLKVAKRKYYDSVMANDEKHARKIDAHKKWREWAKENDPDYWIRKREAQERWRMKQRMILKGLSA